MVRDKLLKRQMPFLASCNDGKLEDLEQITKALQHLAEVA